MFFWLPECSAYPGPLSVFVMDNASIHDVADILELADRFGAHVCFFYMFDGRTYTTSGVRIEFLPPYTPDLNPIEEACSKIKLCQCEVLSM
jgi:transposase